MITKLIKIINKISLKKFPLFFSILFLAALSSCNLDQI